MDLSSTLRGMTCPTVTPFDAATKQIDYDAYSELIDALTSSGIDALFPCGTTGEFASLSPDERRRLVEFTVDATDDDVPILAGAAATSVEETTAYIDDAANSGADAAVVVPPYFHTANDPAGNRTFFESVADRSPLPLLLYNIPACTGGAIAAETVAALATHENVIGLKDSSGDLEYFLRVMWETPEEFLLLQGYDALLVPSLRMGADGGVNALSNAIPDVYAEAVSRATDDRGRELQREVISPLFDACSAYGFAPATKAAAVDRGLLPTDAVRPPLVPVPSDGVESIAESLSSQ